MNPQNLNDISATAITLQQVDDIELATVLKTYVTPAAKTEDPFLVAFDEQFDAENPKDWPTSKMGCNRRPIRDGLHPYYGQHYHGTRTVYNCV